MEFLHPASNFIAWTEPQVQTKVVSIPKISRRRMSALPVLTTVPCFGYRHASTKFTQHAQIRRPSKSHMHTNHFLGCKSMCSCQAGQGLTSSQLSIAFNGFQGRPPSRVKLSEESSSVGALLDRFLSERLGFFCFGFS